MPPPQSGGSGIADRVLQSLALAAGYFAAGWAGSLLAIPPGYSSAFWLPAGIALVAVLVRGRAAWPGLLLGSFLINMFISAKAVGFHGPLLASVPLALGMLWACADRIRGVNRWRGRTVRIQQP